MKKWIFFLFILSGISCQNQKNSSATDIGYFFPDVMHGITFLNENNQAFVFRIGYVNSEGEYVRKFIQHRENQPGQKYGPSAPDYSYNRNGFTADKGNVVWLEWSKLKDEKGAVGKIYCNASMEIILEAMQAWPDELPVSYKFSGDGIDGWLEKPEAPENPDWTLKILNKTSICQTFANKEEELVLQVKNRNATVPEKETSKWLASVYHLSPDQPLYFYSGSEKNSCTPKTIDQRLETEKSKYENSRFKIKTPMGEIWEAVSNHLNHSRVYGTQTGFTGYVVNRGWCNTINQRLFCWDTFFHAMIASLEDPQGAQESVKAILAHQTPIGIVPNNTFGNDTANNSNDRTQYPVGSICVWKMHQYQPDIKFLKEVYPQLLKWHQWWFNTRPENDMIYRDGNRNGVLEGGSETGLLQNAKYELLDNSPMFDDVRMNTESRTMELDMAGLSGIWAADALYLSYIAEELGKMEDAQMLREDVKRMNSAINEVLWNEELGMYCNKYWNEFSRKPLVEDFHSIPDSEFASDITMTYTNKAGEKVKKVVSAIALSQRQSEYFSGNNTEVVWEAVVQTKTPDEYFFYTPEEMGVVLEVEDKVLIDNRKFWITEFISNPVLLEKEKQYKIKLTYTGDIPFELLWSKKQKHSGSLFSDCLTPMLFYPLISKAPDSLQAVRILQNMMDTTLFWGDYVIPTVSRNHPSFPTEGYWRGRIWPPTNYLVYLGLKNYASDEVVAEFVKKSVEMAQKEWMQQGHLHENYSAISGKGMGTASYCWGGLMQFMLLEELIGINSNEKKERNQALKGEYEIVNFPQ